MILPDFERYGSSEDPRFVSYKKSLGIRELDYVIPKYSASIAKKVKDTAEEIAHPARGSIHSWPEFAALYEVVLGRHNTELLLPLGHTVNSGTFRGSNACVMALALKDRFTPPTAPMITIDPFTYAHRAVYEKDTPMSVLVDHYKIIDEFKLRENIVSIIHEDTKYLAKVFGEQPISIAVIDTDKCPCHFEEQINLLIPLIPAGGWFITHDYQPGWNEFLIAVHNFITTCPREITLWWKGSYLFVHFFT